MYCSCAKNRRHENDIKTTLRRRSAGKHCSLEGRETKDIRSSAKGPFAIHSTVSFFFRESRYVLFTWREPIYNAQNYIRKTIYDRLYGDVETAKVTSPSHHISAFRKSRFAHFRVSWNCTLLIDSRNHFSGDIDLPRWHIYIYSPLENIILENKDFPLPTYKHSRFKRVTLSLIRENLVVFGPAYFEKKKLDNSIFNIQYTTK